MTLRARWVTLRARWVSSLGDAKSSLGDAKSSLGDAKSAGECHQLPLPTNTHRGEHAQIPTQSVTSYTESTYQKSNLAYIGTSFYTAQVRYQSGDLLTCEQVERGALGSGNLARA